MTFDLSMERVAAATGAFGSQPDQRGPGFTTVERNDTWRTAFYAYMNAFRGQPDTIDARRYANRVRDRLTAIEPTG